MPAAPGGVAVEVGGTIEAVTGYRLGGLHHVQLAIPAGAEDGCRAFWRDTLGMTELADNLPGHRRFYTRDRVGNRLEFLQPHPGGSS